MPPAAPSTSTHSPGRGPQTSSTRSAVVPSCSTAVAASRSTSPGTNDGMLNVGHRELGVAARPAGTAGVRGHRPAEPFRAHRLADRDDLPPTPLPGT